METFNQALIDCVKAAGGSAIVGGKLWPEKVRRTPEGQIDPGPAQRALLDHLDPSRPAKLSPDQVLLIMRLAREKGHHGGVAYILSELGYAPTTPIEPRDEAAELMRQYIEAVAEQKRTADRMEKAAARLGMRAVA